MTEISENQMIDTSGLSCPLPILKSKKAIKSMNVGEILKIISTDPGSLKDIESWSKVTGQELLSSEKVAEKKFVFFVKKLK